MHAAPDLAKSPSRTRGRGGRAAVPTLAIAMPLIKQGVQDSGLSDPYHEISFTSGSHQRHVARGHVFLQKTKVNVACMICGKQGKLHRTYIHYLCSSTPFRIKSSGAMPTMIWLTGGVSGGVSRRWGTTMPFW